MAEKRFYFWQSYELGMMSLATDADRGEMVRAMCAWAFRGEWPDFSGRPQFETAWAFISGQLKTSVEIGENNADKGRKSGESRRKKSDKGKTNTVANTVQNTVANDMNGHERTGHVPDSFQESVAGFASAPSGAGSPADDDEAFRKSFMMSQAMVGRPMGGGR